MIDCNTTRDYLALQALEDDPQVQAHLANCPACATFRRRHAAMDMVLRKEMHWEVPGDLTARLMAIAATAAVVPSTPQMVRPPARYVTLFYTLMVLAVVMSIGVAWQILGLMTGQLGIFDLMAQWLAVPLQSLTELTANRPEVRYVIDFALKVREQLLWLLLVAVLWAVLDKWNPQFSFRFRRPQAS